MTHVPIHALAMSLLALPLAGCVAEPDDLDQVETSTQELNGDTWVTVDNYGTNPDDFANGIAVSPTTGRIFVVGYTLANNGSWLIRTSDDGVTFTTNSTFQLVGGLYASASAVAIDGVGRIFVTGTAQDGSSSYRWVTRRSSDNGATWQTVDNTTPTSRIHNIAMPTSIAIDAAGDVYVGGGFGRTGQRGWWAVRRGFNHGASWSTVDTAVGSHVAGIGQPTLNTLPQGMCAANGKIFAIGFDTNAANTAPKWIVRAAAPTGPWSQVDVDTSESAGYGCGGSSTQVFITGGVSSGGVAYARTKRSSDGGVSWTTVENTANASGRAIGFGAGGVLYRAGTDSSTPYSRWRVRRSPDQGVTWIDSDDFILGGAGAWSRAKSLALAPTTSKLYVAGDASDAAGSRIVVRRLP